MNIQLPNNVKNFINKLNDAGIPLPMFRDCLTGKPSITYTLTLAASVMVILGIVKSTNHLVDYEKAVSFLQLVGGGYLVRQTMKHIAPIKDGDDSSNSNQ